MRYAEPAWSANLARPEDWSQGTHSFGALKVLEETEQTGAKIRCRIGVSSGFLNAISLRTSDVALADLGSHC